MNSRAVLSVLAVFVAVAFGGACLNDYNTNQPSSAWNQRLWSYTSGSPASKSSSSTLTFMTYNLQSSISSSCQSNAQAQAQYLKGHDFVGNQEVVQGVDTRCNCNMPQILSSTAGLSTRYVMTFPWRTGQYGISAGSSQTVLDTKYFLYNYANAEQRALVALKTQPSGLGGRYLWFISTHLEYTVTAARHSQAQQLVNWVNSNILASDQNAIVVVVGDFNAGPWDQMYTTMSALFKNTWEVYNNGIGGGNTYPADGPGSRFDHIWYRVPSGVTVSVQNCQIPDVRYSDHRPLIGTLKFTVSGSSPAPAVTPSPTKAPSAAPTSAPNKAATSAPTPAPSSSSAECAVSYGYDSTGSSVVITNIGTKPIKSLTVAFSSALPSNNWNWVAKGGNQYTLPTWAFSSLSSKNGRYVSSGYYTTGSRPSASTASISC